MASYLCQGNPVSLHKPVRYFNSRWGEALALDISGLLINTLSVISKKRKAVPVQPAARTITAFSDSYIGLRDYQASPALSPSPPTL